MDNTKTIRKIFQTSIFEVFEKMFFVFLEGSSKRRLECQLAASINFSGRKNGKMTVYFSKGVSDVMLQNMLNIQPEEATEKLLEDCVKESVNMICGGFLRNFDASSVFDLSLPVIESARGDILVEEIEKEDMVSMTFDSDAGVIGVSLIFN